MKGTNERKQRRMPSGFTLRILLPLLLLTAFCPVLNSQSVPAPAASRSRTSIADAIRNPHGRELHIFYIHGIGSDGPDDYDSLALRKSICGYLKDCTTPAGTAIGGWDYADQAEFQADAPVPALQYMNDPVWKNQEEWRAASPYAIHYQIARSGGPSIYVDELNWWPLTFSLKCRQIVASDAAFVAPNKKRIEVCSRRTPNPDAPQRFKSYDWISNDQAAQMLKLRSKGARVNRQLKNGLMDWGFSDAVMSLGAIRPYILNGLRQLILKSLNDSPEAKANDPAQPPLDQEFIIVSHSLGSYLIFSALNVDPDHVDSTSSPSVKKFQQILARTNLVYFFANQLRLLELASLDSATDKSLVVHLNAWGNVRCSYLKTLPNSDQQCPPPRITALNDPSDLLTWTVPSLPTVEVKNVSVRNAPYWLGLIEDPSSAHDDYVRDRQVIQEMLKDGSDAEE